MLISHHEETTRSSIARPEGQWCGTPWVNFFKKEGDVVVLANDAKSILLWDVTRLTVDAREYNGTSHLSTKLYHGPMESVRGNSLELIRLIVVNWEWSEFSGVEGTSRRRLRLKSVSVEHKFQKLRPIRSYPSRSPLPPSFPYECHR